MAVRKPKRRTSLATTLHDVAEAAGVSPMTVSRVIAGNGSVNDEMRARVEGAIVRTGYVPNPAARNLASGGATRIGILYGNPSGIFTNEMLVSLLEGASSLGCQLVLEKCADAAAAHKRVGSLIKSKIDGAIVSAPLCDDEELAAAFVSAGVPSLALCAARDAGHALSILIDNEAAAREATRYLIKMGHREIGFVRGHPLQVDSERRFAGYAAALKEAGIAVRADRIAQGDYSYRSGLDAADQLLAHKRDRPTAIFASNDEMAAGVFAAAHRLGLAVPAQLSILGFDDTALASTLWPSLTTVRQPIAEFADRGLHMMMDKLRGRSARRKAAGRSVTLKLKLVKRESVVAR